MRVLQINSVCGIGSTGRIATDIHEILIEQGHESYIAYGRGLPSNCNNTIKIGTKYDNYTHVVKTRIFDKHGFGSKQATKEFIQKVKELDPDIIHLHNIHGYYINVEILFKYLKESNRKVVWSLYDCWSFTGHCTHFDLIGCTKWEKGCYDCFQKTKYPASYVLDNSKNNYLRKRDITSGISNLTIVPPTNWLCNLLAKSYLDKFTKIIIPSGIDVEIFKPTTSDLRKKLDLDGTYKYIILTVSNGFSESKGFSYYLDLAENLPKDYRLVMLGAKKKEMKRIPPNILALPRTSNTKELAQFYTVSDVFVNLSLQETQGLTSIESLACGTQVVAFDSGGIPECIGSNCGYIIKRGDSDGLLKAVVKACKTPFNKEDCISSAKRFNKTDIYSKYIKLYEQLLLN